MTVLSFLIILLVGAAAGALSGLFLRCKGYCLALNIVVGILGAFFGNWLFQVAGVQAFNNFGQTLIAAAGAVLVLWPFQALVKALGKKR